MAALCKPSSCQRLLSITHRGVVSTGSSNIQARSYKKKIPKNEDPKNMSWAKPLFEYHEQQLKEGEKEIQPAILHMVRRVKPMKGRPYWEKETLKALKLDGKSFRPQVHKNTPEVNRLLKTVKHLIEIQPVTFPYGLPTDETDYEHCQLCDNGEFVVTKKIEPSETEDVKVVNRPEERDQWEMNPETIKSDNMKKLSSYNLLTEYFQTQYTYRYNQDKKEYRYNGDRNIARGRDWY